MEKPLAEFSPRRSRGPRGTSSYCKPCQAARARESYRRHHAERLAANRARLPKKLEWQRERMQDPVYRARRAADRNAQYWRDPEKAREASLRWQRNHPEKNRERNARRKARMKGNGYEPIDPQRVYERDGGVCHLCGEPVPPSEASLDHVIPIAHGGPHYYSNVALAHLICNVRRQDKPIADLKPKRGEQVA